MTRRKKLRKLSARFINKWKNEPRNKKGRMGGRQYRQSPQNAAPQRKATKSLLRMLLAQKPAVCIVAEILIACTKY